MYLIIIELKIIILLYSHIECVTTATNVQPFSSCLVHKLQEHRGLIAVHANIMLNFHVFYVSCK